MAITKEQFKKCFAELPSTRIDELWPAMDATMKRYRIDTPLRAAAFFATVGHESASFKYVSENLNYSAEALQVTFKKYFSSAVVAASYARNPKAIASRVYANRMGNGDEKSGDGWTYRGAGFIQITGKRNMSAFALAIGVSLTEAAEYLRTVSGACLGAGWFWEANALNKWADRDNIVAVSGLVNTGSPNASEGSINGMPDRKARYSKYKKILGA